MGCDPFEPSIPQLEDRIVELEAENAKKDKALQRIKSQCEIEMIGSRNSAFPYMAALADEALTDD